MFMPLLWSDPKFQKENKFGLRMCLMRFSERWSWGQQLRLLWLKFVVATTIVANNWDKALRERGITLYQVQLPNTLMTLNWSSTPYYHVFSLPVFLTSWPFFSCHFSLRHTRNHYLIPHWEREGSNTVHTFHICMRPPPAARNIT